ncbi:MAG TPA: LTA synthase family protein [Candidatus Faecalibacterium gallistercoris]|uniref:LTA synthase family protein n=1 Tax=Candidatus Faecalibacterium gallistercoris TaxID=2838579 RepID=A0A9D2FFN3_9FIRM|nr:LTA synthase family protein [Candidatus Faecalibacterium gallistercoris]
MKHEHTAAALGVGLVRGIFPPLAAGIFLVLTEWVARGEWTPEIWTEYIRPHYESYILSWMLLALIWAVVDTVTRLAPLATFVSGCAGLVPAAVNFYTLQLRGEPFLPWDLTQVKEAAGVAAAAGLKVQPSMVWAGGALLTLTALSHFLYRRRGRPALPVRLVSITASLAALLALVFGVFLQPAVTQSFGIYPDAWMQDRYYRWYGVITGFMTNLTNLEIDEPEGYSEEAVNALLDETEAAGAIRTGPNFPDSYAARTDPAAIEKEPTIIYVMDESYWDVSELEQYGVTFDTDVSPNLHALQQTSAYGKVYSPSFGGGTCDVEFEALTGHSVGFLPSGCKPYQQHVTRPMFALPSYLKDRGYQTAAVHCYYAKYWSRNTAYPNLGFDDFVSLEDMRGVEKVRGYYWKGGLVTDASMGEQIIGEYERLKAASDAPVFLHAVTMQNHTNYNAANYPDDQRVHVTSAPAGLKASTVGALEDFATGVRDADALLGQLVSYFSQVDEPVILVFWGDHYNPIDSGYDVYTATGYASADSADPRLHQTTLLMWSNYSNYQVDLGTIAAYEISPVMMDLFGLEQPLYFQYLNRQLRYGYRSCTGGVTVNWDGTVGRGLTGRQTAWRQDHWLLQYDLMFGKGYALDRMGLQLEKTE